MFYLVKLNISSPTRFGIPLTNYKMYLIHELYYSIVVSEPYDVLLNLFYLILCQFSEISWT